MRPDSLPRNPNPTLLLTLTLTLTWRLRQVMWYDSLRSKWRYLVEPSFAAGSVGLRTDSSQMPGEHCLLSGNTWGAGPLQC